MPIRLRVPRCLAWLLGPAARPTARLRALPAPLAPARVPGLQSQRRAASPSSLRPRQSADPALRRNSDTSCRSVFASRSAASSRRPVQTAVHARRLRFDCAVGPAHPVLYRFQSEWLALSPIRASGQWPHAGQGMRRPYARSRPDTSAMKELRGLSHETGLFGSVDDAQIAAAEEAPPPVMEAYAHAGAHPEVPAPIHSRRWHALCRTCARGRTTGGEHHAGLFSRSPRVCSAQRKPVEAVRRIVALIGGQCCTDDIARHLTSEGEAMQRADAGYGTDD